MAQMPEGTIWGKGMYHFLLALGTALWKASIGLFEHANSLNFVVGSVEQDHIRVNG